MQPADATVDNLELGPLMSNARGGKTSNFERPVKLALKGVTTPFEVSSFDGTSDRKSLDLRSSPELREFCARLDQRLKTQGGQITCKPEGYKSLLKPQKKGYEPLFRTKLTLSSSGKTPVKIFDEAKRRLSEQEISEICWRDCTMNVLLSIRGCYVQSGQWGPLAHVEAIMLRQEAACPFDDEPECDP